jgi:hypothetical protein
MAIPFTQYIPPNGRKRKTSYPCDAETQALADQFIEAGGWFTVEILPYNVVSVCACFKVVEDVDGEEYYEELDVAVELYRDAKGAGIEPIKELVRKALIWLKAQETAGRDSS